MWGSNNTLNEMTGEQVFDFIDLIDEICKFKTDKFVTTESQHKLLKSLQCWKYILPFLRTIYIININNTKAEHDEFEENYVKLLVSMKTTIQDFYVHAGNTFMTKVDNGDKEIFVLQ